MIIYLLWLHYIHILHSWYIHMQAIMSWVIWHKLHHLPSQEAEDDAVPWPDGPPPGDWEEPEEEAPKLLVKQTKKTTGSVILVWLILVPLEVGIFFLEVGLANVDTDGLELDLWSLQVWRALNKRSFVIHFSRNIRHPYSISKFGTAKGSCFAFAFTGGSSCLRWWRRMRRGSGIAGLAAAVQGMYSKDIFLNQYELSFFARSTVYQLGISQNYVMWWTFDSIGFERFPSWCFYALPAKLRSK